MQEESEEEEETLVPVTGLPQITVVLESAEREVLEGSVFGKYYPQDGR